MATNFEDGQRVLAARWPGENCWYPGKVYHVDQVNNVVIDFEEGGRAHVPADRVKLFDWDAGTRVHCNMKRMGSRNDMATIVELEPGSGRVKLKFDDSPNVMSTFTHRCSSD